MHRPNRVFVYLILLSSHAGWAAHTGPSSPGTASIDRPIVTPSGVTLTVPQFWSVHRAHLLLVSRPPETDTQIAIVDAGNASDALDAAAHAWSVYRSASPRRVTLTTARAPRNGWDEQVRLEYENSPSEHTGADPNRLTLELTESLLVHNVEDVIEKMTALKKEGVNFALDDFGTGYSSLYYLKRLPLDQLKIDRSFVRDVLTDPDDAAIAKTIVALAQTLGLEVIAEGIETAEQRAALASSGCHYYQGYFFSRPLPLESFERFIYHRGQVRPLLEATA